MTKAMKQSIVAGILIFFFWGQTAIASLDEKVGTPLRRASSRDAAGGLEPLEILPALAWEKIFIEVGKTHASQILLFQRTCKQFCSLLRDDIFLRQLSKALITEIAHTTQDKVVQKCFKEYCEGHSVTTEPLETLRIVLKVWSLLQDHLSLEQIFGAPYQRTLVDMQTLAACVGTQFTMRLEMLPVLPWQLAQVTHIRKLHVSASALMGPHPFFFSAKHLKKLSIHQQRLRVIPKTIFELGGLEELDLSENLLRDVPSAIGKLSRLKNLWLSHNEFQTFPLSVCALSSLTQLCLKGNQLTTLPPQIGKLRKLELLRLNQNELQELPPEIGQLQRLQKLYAFENHLLAVPAAIGHCRQLKKLFLGRNFLSKLPEELAYCTTLQLIMLDHNQFQTIPMCLLKLPRLAILDLTGNWMARNVIDEFLQKRVVSRKKNRELRVRFQLT